MTETSDNVEAPRAPGRSWSHLSWSHLSWSHLLRDEAGQDLIEYALVAAIVGLGAIASLKGLSTKIGTSFSTVSSTLTSAV